MSKRRLFPCRRRGRCPFLHLNHQSVLHARALSLRDLELKSLIIWLKEVSVHHWSPLTAEAWRIHHHLPYVNLHGNDLWGLDLQNELICKVVWGETPTHWNTMESSSDNLFLGWGCSDGHHFLFSSVFYSLFWMQVHWLDYMTIFSDLPVHEASREPVLLCFAQTWTYGDANRNSYVWGL